MDDGDDAQLIIPDSKGKLDLTNRAWIILDPLVWTFHASLVILDISYNNIVELPPQIGEMSFLKELHVSFNKLTRLPSAIGRLKRLRRLVLNGNRLKNLPDELGRLEQLEELNLSENKLTYLPASIKYMENLSVLKVQNNDLLTLPPELAEVVALKVVDLSNNKNLSMIPASGRGDSQVVLFIMSIHRDYLSKMEEISRSNEELSKHAQYLEQDVLLMKEQIVSLTARLESDYLGMGAETGVAAIVKTTAATGGFFSRLTGHTPKVAGEH